MDDLSRKFSFDFHFLYYLLSLKYIFQHYSFHLSDKNIAVLCLFDVYSALEETDIFSLCPAVFAPVIATINLFLAE